MDKNIGITAVSSIANLVILKSSTYHFVCVDQNKVFADAIKSVKPDALLIGAGKSSNDATLIAELKALGVREVVIKG
jgi:hypothetical protein